MLLWFECVKPQSGSLFFLTKIYYKNMIFYD